MNIKPKAGVLLIRKHINTALDADIAIEESDDDKRLITGEVLSDNSEEFKKGVTIFFGKYSIFQLTIKGEDFCLIEEDDVIGTCDYKEKTKKK